MGFNRYIVECKYTTPVKSNTKVDGFNRYIVECKFANARVVFPPFAF